MGNVFGRSIGARQLRGVFQTSDVKKAVRCLCPLVALEFAPQTQPRTAQHKGSVMIWVPGKYVFEQMSDASSQGQKVLIKSQHLLLCGKKSIWSVSSIQYKYIRIAQCENIRMIQWCKQGTALKRKDKKQPKNTEGYEVPKCSLRKVWI